MSRLNIDNVKYRMQVARVRQKDIAVFLGVSPQAINQVVNGFRSTRRIRNAISAAVGLPVSELWPETPQTKNTSVPAGRSNPSVGCLVGTEDPSRD